MLKLSRLIQPRNPQFWLLVALNALSAAISFILRAYSLSTAATLLLAAFAIANLVIGLRIALALLAAPPSPPSPPAAPAGDSADESAGAVRRGE